jgi:membrane associated rhomboid family serine protease
MKIRFTYALLALLVVVFVAELAFPQLVDALAFSPARFGEQPWSIVTALFLHADLGHLAANLVVLWFFGLAAEREIGRTKALVVFLLGGIAGEIASLVIYPWDAFSLGASGGIFALMGVVMLVRPVETELRGWAGAPATIPLAFLAGIYIFYNVLGAFSGPSDIAYGAHFAGLALGLAVGLYARSHASRKRRR